MRSIFLSFIISSSILLNPIAVNAGQISSLGCACKDSCGTSTFSSKPWCSVSSSSCPGASYTFGTGYWDYCTPATIGIACDTTLVYNSNLLYCYVQSTNLDNSEGQYIWAYLTPNTASSYTGSGLALLVKPNQGGFYFRVTDTDYTFPVLNNSTGTPVFGMKRNSSTVIQSLTGNKIYAFAISNDDLAKKYSSSITVIDAPRTVTTVSTSNTGGGTTTTTTSTNNGISTTTVNTSSGNGISSSSTTSTSGSSSSGIISISSSTSSTSGSTYSSSTSCSLGQYFINGLCYDCPDGQVSPGGTTRTCSACPSGQITLDGFSCKTIDIPTISPTPTAYGSGVIYKSSSTVSIPYSKITTIALFLMLLTFF